MKRWSFVLTFVTVAFSVQANAQWSRVSGSFDDKINTIAAHGGVLSAGTPSGLFCSVDYGSHWTVSNNGLPDYMYVTSLTIDDSNEYAGVLGGIFRSTDNGKDWTFLSPQIKYSYFWNISANSNLIFAGTGGGGIYRSIDQGMSWDTVNSGLPANSYVESIQILGSKVFAGVYGGCYYSSDSGSHWSIVISPEVPRDLNAFVVVDSTLFAGGFAGLFKSIDMGSNWTKSVLPLSPIDGIIALTNAGMAVFAATMDGNVILSTDDGTNWTNVSAGLTDTTIHTLASDGTFLYAGTDTGVWRRPLSEMIATSAVAARLSAQKIIYAYPNPLSQSTTISFTPDAAGYADISIVNLLGIEVAHLFSGVLEAGDHSFLWSTPTGLPDGTYECLVRMNGRVEKLPVMLLR